MSIEDKDKKSLKDAADEAKGIFRTKSGFSILPVQYERINPAWTIVNGELWITHPLTHRMKRPAKVDGKDKLIEREVQENFVITSGRDAFPSTEDNFSEKRLVAHVPETVLDKRWSIESIMAFLKGRSRADPYQLFERVKKRWEYLMDLDNIPGAYTVSAIWDIYTYFFPLFQWTPYKWYMGKTKSAKSKNGVIDSLIAFNAFSSVDMTGPNLFRTIQETLGTIFVDEYEKSGKNRNKSEKQMDLEALLNAGFELNARVPRIEKQGNKMVRVLYDVFAPKVICGIGVVTETLENRSFKFPMLRTTDRKKSRREPNPKNPEWQEIRDQLYLLLMHHWKEVQKIADDNQIENRLDLSERDWNKAKPLLVVTQFIANNAGSEGKKILDDLWAFLTFQLNLQKEGEIDSWDYSIVDSVESLIRNTAKPLDRVRQDEDTIEIRLIDLTERVATAEGMDVMKINKTGYGRSLRKEIERLGIGSNFHRGHGNVLMFDTSLAIVKVTKERYFTDKAVQIDNLDNNDNFDKNDNHDNQAGSLAGLSSRSNDNPNDNPPPSKENSGSADDGLSRLSLLSHVSTVDENFDPIDEEILLITYYARKINVHKIAEKWHNLSSPMVSEIRNKAVLLATMDNPYIRFENDSLEWIRERWDS